jgi:hypothetical protein
VSESDAARRSLERLLERLAGEDARGLLDEARAAARERVRAQLTDELAQRMLDRIAGEHMAAGRGAGGTAPAAAGEPAETTSSPDRTGALGVYVYAVIAPDGGAVGLGGGIGDAPVRIVESEPDGLRALVSDVPLDEFGDDALKRNLNDLSWVSATAVAHEAVVEAAMRGATLVPMRMCTIFLDEDAVREMLRREAAALGEALARLRGAHEWGLKVIADREAFAAAIADEGDAQGSAQGGLGGSGEGAGYFAALRLDRVAREEVAAALDERTREIHESIAALATDSRLRPPSNRELGGYEGDMVLNGAYLVPAARTDELRARAASLAERHGAAGLTVELTGPWPPYNFSTLAGGL